jgi:hypothetical protein
MQNLTDRAAGEALAGGAAGLRRIRVKGVQRGQWRLTKEAPAGPAAQPRCTDTISETRVCPPYKKTY